MLLRILPLILLALPVSPARYEPTTRPPLDPAAIDKVVREYRDTTGIPGVAVAVTHGRTVVHTAGYGRTGNGEPVTDRTVLAVASVSKSITALAVLQLVDAGRIELDRPVRTYLPEFVMADDRAARITVRQLLNQTSGMSDTTYRSFSGPQLHTLQEAVASMRSARLAADPGARYEYHNPNYQVAARLVEVASGMSFDSYLRARVFGPSGMTDSRTGNTSDDLPPSGRGHLVIAGQGIAVPEPPAFGNGSGGVLSTAHDMANWLITQTQQGAAADGTRVVSAAAVQEMHRAQAGSYGLGWNIGQTRGGTPLVDHDGTMLTFTAYEALLPATGYAIAVMANTNTGATASDIGAALVDLVEGRPPTPPSRAARWTDLVMLGLIPVAIVLAVRGVRRSRRWADRRAPLAVLRLAPYALPILLLATLDRVMSFLYRGRDITWLQTAYLVPAFVLLLAALAATCSVLLTARLWWLTRPGPAPAGSD